MSKEADTIFEKWKMAYSSQMSASSSKKDTRKQLVFDLFSAFKMANCDENDALSYVSAVKKYIMPDNSFFDNAYNKSSKKRSKKDFIQSIKDNISEAPENAYNQYYPFNVNGVEVKAELPKDQENKDLQPDDDKWEVRRFYEISAAMGITPEEPWYYKFNDGTPKLKPDGTPRKTMGDHIKKKN